MGLMNARNNALTPRLSPFSLLSFFFFFFFFFFLAFPTAASSSGPFFPSWPWIRGKPGERIRGDRRIRAGSSCVSTIACLVGPVTGRMEADSVQGNIYRAIDIPKRPQRGDNDLWRRIAAVRRLCSSCRG
ncbi:hypothetical protein B0J12DRAFT_178826 [Macrophomina phaseolina]|uniref:Secreted protein n=1 Tax=Macrophomina phaseolina TaxID=35725 RepID=A0ABQ8GTR9_9PEZI|nr:hypothetical protein B0J12DRAFT_178826 [Macrophomina phaseolina]